jgi:hypothetical protein
MTATVALLQDAIKTYYPQTKVEDALFSESPTFAIMPKKSWVGGTPMHLAIALSGTPGSHTFSNAQTVSGTRALGAFQVTHTQDYNVVRIETVAERLSSSDAASLMRGVKSQADGALYSQAKTLGIEIHRSGSGSRGRIGSGADSATLTLTDPNDAYNFEIGDVLVSNDTDDATTVSANSTTITAIDYVAGTLTAGAAWHADFDTNDYLFRIGDPGLGLTGFAGWNPSSAPSATTFFGKDRTQSSRLYGVIYDYTVAADGTMERYLVNMLTRCCRLGGNPKHIVMSPIRWGNFVNELGDKVRFSQMYGKRTDGSESTVGFETISVMGPKGKVDVIADPYCPHNVVRALDMNHWAFYHIGKIGWIEEDGAGQWLRQASADGKEARLGWFGQVCSDFPGASAVGSVSALPG